MSRASLWSAMYFEKYRRRSHDSPRTQYFLSAPNYFVYSKIFLLVQKSLICELCLWAVLQCFVAYLTGVSVRNKFYIRTEEGTSPISQYEGQLYYQYQAWGSELNPQHLHLKNLMWHHAPGTPVLGRQSKQLLGASWPASLTIQQWFPMQCDRISKK